MKMICDRTLLSNAVAGVSKAVTQRSSCLLYTSPSPRD